jgi:creatinine amidohydrolase
VTAGASPTSLPPERQTEWRNLTAPEVSARFAAGAIALWPIGATEQHGPHVATGFDHVAAEAVVHAAAARLVPDVVVLPTLSLGCSPHWMSLGGTLSLTHETLFAVLREVCHSVKQAGASHIVMVNGHMGNVGTGISVLSEFVDPGLNVEFVSYWDLIERRVLVDTMQHDAGVGHAGEFETAIGLHLGDLVREQAIPRAHDESSWAGSGFDGPSVHRAVRSADDTVDGVVGSASAATPRLGRVVVQAAVDGLVTHCVEVLRDVIPK